MKKVFLGLSFLLTIVAFQSANAEFYASLGAGTSINSGSTITNHVRSTYKNTPVYSLAGGYELPFISSIIDTTIRAEGEYLRIRPKSKGEGKDSSFDGVMANGYVNIPFPIVDPYVGMGVGMARFDHNNSIAYQGIAGLDYALPMLPLTVSGEYRYLNLNEDGGKHDTSSQFRTHIFMMKLRYNF